MFNFEQTITLEKNGKQYSITTHSSFDNLETLLKREYPYLKGAKLISQGERKSFGYVSKINEGFIFEGDKTARTEEEWIEYDKKAKEIIKARSQENA